MPICLCVKHCDALNDFNTGWRMNACLTLPVEIENHSLTNIVTFFLTVFINIIVEWLQILTRTLKIIVFSAIVDTLCQCLTHASKLTVDSLCRDIIVDLSLYLFSLINTCVAYLFSVLWHKPHPLDWPSIWQHTIIISKYRLSRSTRLELSGKKSPEMSYDFFILLYIFR